MLAPFSRTTSWSLKESKLTATPRVLSREYEGDFCTVVLFHSGQHEWTYRLWRESASMITFETWKDLSWRRSRSLIFSHHPWEGWKPGTTREFHIDFTGRSPDTRAVLDLGEYGTDHSADVVLAYHPDWIG